MQKLFFSLIIFSVCVLRLNAQNISIQENYTDTELVQKLFPDGSCMSPSNISISGHQFNGGKKSYSYFRNSNPNFALSEGILITSGRAESSIGPNRSTLSDGPTSWRGDTDLERAINERNTYNATSIEFEIVAITDELSFDYIFSSEQYLSDPGSHQCDYSDGFAFLVKEATNQNSQYTNIALVPGTNEPVKVSNVRARTRNCPESYVQYFGGFNTNSHPTNYNGQTKVLTAKANVTPGVRYKFKLVVADQGNEKYDSAIFLSASSFRNSINLGLDTSAPLCHGETYTFTPTPVPNVTHYTWYKDNVAITNHNMVSNPNLTVSQPGTYKLEAYINANCIITEEVTVTYNNEVIVPNEIDNVCSFSSQPFTFNILNNHNISFGTNQDDELSYFRSLNEAKANINSISLQELTNYPLNIGENIIYVRGNIGQTGCSGYGTYTINYTNSITNLPSVSLCTSASAPISMLPYLPSQNNIDTIKFFNNIQDAQNNSNELNVESNTSIRLNNGNNIIYILYPNNSCGELYAIEFNIITNNELPNQEIGICNTGITILNAPNGYLNYNWSTGETTQNISVTNAGEYTVTLTTNAGCFITQRFNVLENNSPIYFNELFSICSFNSQIEGIDISFDNYLNNLINIGEIYKIYNSLSDAENEINQINNVVNINSDKTFYVRISNTSGCYIISNITFSVNFSTILNSIDFCTKTNTINIQSLIQDFEIAYPNTIIKIYLSLTDANNNVNSVNNIITTQTSQLYISIKKPNGSCIQNFIQPINAISINDLQNETLTICQNNSVVLQTLVGDFTYLWNNGETTSDIEVSEIGTYIVTITNVNGCSFTQIFIVNESQSAVIEEIQVRHFSNIQNSITVITSGSGSFEYSIDGINFQQSNVFYSVREGEYTVFVKDLNGCGATSQKTLVLDIRNFFTPNGDGIFDTWDVSNIFKVFPNSEVFIIDRFGKIMSFLNDNKTSWNGNSHGKAQPSTDYWYVIKLSNGSEYKGHFSLKR